MRGAGRACGRVVALDLGEAWTGVAISDAGGSIARPLEVVPAGGLVGYLRDLARDEAVAEVVVGVPKTLGGEVGFQARRVLHELKLLRDELPGVRFVEWDERLTTRLALSSVSAGARTRRRGRRKKVRGRVDDVAAARMLQEYLERGGRA